MNIPKIVIIGTGFGGVYTAKNVIRQLGAVLVDVTLIGKQNYFLFTPLLHEVATGSLTPTSITEPIRDIFKDKKINFIQSEVKQIDFDSREIQTTNSRLHFDILILATGSETNYHSVNGAKEYSLPMKNIDDSMKIRSRIIDCFEKAVNSQDKSETEKLLSFIVVGAGASGVELAGEIAEFASSIMKRHCFKKIDYFKKILKITLISASKEILTGFNKKLRPKALKFLQNKGIDILLGQTVSHVLCESIHLQSGKEIFGKTIIWLAGVKPSLPNFRGNIELDTSGKIIVDEFLMIKNYKNVFVLGDACAMYSKNDRKETLPMLAQVAVSEAKSIAVNIKKILSGQTMSPFQYKTKGSLISVGQWRAVGDILGLIVSGRFAWWLWRTVYLFKFLSWRKRLKIVVEWTINVFYPRDITQHD